ncbi:hypothetical protein V2J09_006179 [Rumex salicifolius]
MAPKWQHIPLLFLLSLFGLFVLSRHFLFPPPLSGSSLTALSRPSFSLQTPSTSGFSLSIKLLAYNRLSSLSRCLQALAAADYGTDTVHLHIYIDHFKQPEPASSASVDDDLQNSRWILDFIDGFGWKFGQKLVHYRTVNVGLQAQWLEAWWPSSDDEFVFVVEDDLEVSPLYYQFLKGKHGNKMHLDHDTRLFLYQLVGTWGQLLFPKPWKEFRIWYDIHKAKGIKPILDGMVTTGWYKRMGERIWTPWFIKFIHSRGYFNLYTNFLNERALSISHRDAGVNYGKTAGPDSYLLNESDIDFNLMDMKPLSELKRYDFCFRENVPGRVVKELSEVGSILSSMHKQKPVFIISLFKASEPVVRNLLCHLERLNVQNYVLVTPNLDLLLDLSRRGHPVIDADQFFDSIESSIGYLKPSSEPIKEIIVNAFITKKCLEAGLNCYLVEGNRMLLINSPIVVNDSPMSDFYAFKASGIFYVRSTSSSRTKWDKMLSKAELIADTVRTQDHGNFANAIVELLDKLGVSFKTPDETISIVKLDSILANANQSSVEDTAKIIYWSSDKGSDAIQKRLVELGLWLIDRDSSCNAVFCHQS